jgi:hypothetical protein
VVELAYAIEPVQDGRVYIERINEPSYSLRRLTPNSGATADILGPALWA